MNEESRNELHAQFVLAFASHDPAPHAVSESELAELAKLLTTHLPASYSQFLRGHGPVFCPTILRLTLDHGLDHPDLRQILTAWPELSPELRTAVLAVTRAAKRIHDNS